jgi:ABC-type nitrate/sulfonate/bicarbonate transport system substrate-binding protein
VSQQGLSFFRLFSAWFEPRLTEAAPAGARTIKLAVISEGLNAWPLYVAKERKLFEKEGINVEVTLTGSSVMQLEQLTTGGFDIGFQQSDHVVRGVEQGSDLFVFMAQGHAPDLSLVVAPGIKTFAELKGRDIAVDGARTGYALLLRKLLANNGLKDGDFTFTEFGGSRERFDALKRGAAFASLLNPPFDRNLFAAGFGSLGTINDYFPAYPGAIAAARRSWAQRHETELIAFIRAFNAGYAWLQDPDHKAEAIRILPGRLGIEPEAAAKAFERLARRPRPEISPAGLQQVIDVVWEAEGYQPPKGAPEKYLDLSYFKKASQ